MPIYSPLPPRCFSTIHLTKYAPQPKTWILKPTHEACFCFCTSGASSISPINAFPLACFTYFVLGSFFEWVDTFDQHWHIDGLTSYGVLSSVWIVTYYDTWATFTWLLHWHATKQSRNDLLSWCFRCYVYYVHILLAVNFPIVRRILK